MPDNQPNFSQVDPTTGEVTAVFPGGIEMFASSPPVPQLTRRVAWVRETDGALVAYAAAFTGPGSDSLEIRMPGDETGNPARIGVSAETGFGNDGVGLSMLADGTGVGDNVPLALVSSSDVNGLTDAPAVVALVDAFGRSSFIKLPIGTFGAPTLDLRLVFGAAVNAPALGVGVQGSSPAFDTLLSSVQNDQGAPLNFVRPFGSYMGTAGNQLAYGFSVATGGGTVVIQASHRNVSAAASGAVSFAQMCLVAYS